MNVNIWLALRDSAQDAIVTRLRWDEDTQGPYTGPVSNRTERLFRYMQGFADRQRLFKRPTLGGNRYTLWSITFSDSVDVLQKVRDELDDLEAKYPSLIVVAGAWIWQDGDMACRQAGTQLTIGTRSVVKTYSKFNPDYQPDPEAPLFDDRFVLRVTEPVEESYVSGSTGTPLYPLSAQLLKFMPDLIDADGVVTPPTELTDVNLLMGQPPRSFI